MKRILVLCLIFMTVLTIVPTSHAQSDEVLARIDQAMEHLGQYLGGITITRESNRWFWSEQIYPDASLGCPAPGNSYAQVQTRAYRIRIIEENVEYDYRITPNGDLLVLCGGDGNALFRTDTPVVVQPPAQSTYQVAPAAWYSWVYLPLTDRLFLINPTGEQAILKRPTIPNESTGTPPRMAISPSGRYMVEVMPLNTGVEALAVYDFQTGQIINTIQAPVGETINIGWGSSGSPSAGSTFIFDPLSTRAAVGFANTNTGAWRVALIDLATGAITQQLNNIDLSNILQNSSQALSDAVGGLGTFFPRVVYYDGLGGIHVQLILANAGGAARYPAFVWYPSVNTADVSPYEHSSIDILPPTGTALFTYNDTTATSLAPNGPFESHNAVARGLPGGLTFVPENIYRNSNFYHFSPQWADNGQKVIFIVSDGVNPNRWAFYDPQNAAANNFLPEILPDTYTGARGVVGGMLVFNNSLNLSLFSGNNTFTQIWTAPPQNGEPALIWVQPANTLLGITSIDLSTWGQGSTTPVTQPGILYCAGTPASRVAVGQRARVSFTDGTPLRLRETPSTSGTFLQDLREGTEFTVIGGPQCADGYTWWQIRLDNGTSGWSAEGDSDDYFMEPRAGSAPSSSVPSTNTNPSNPAVTTTSLGQFRTTFQANEWVTLSHGVTLGNQAVCRFHNIALTDAEKGKILTVTVNGSDLLYPTAVYPSIPFWVSLYRSNVGAWQGQQTIDVQAGQATQLVRDITQLFLSWTIDQAGDYVICLEAFANTYNDPAVRFNSASYSVSLIG